MKPFSLTSLLLLVILFSAARGIRLEKGFFKSVNQGEKTHEDVSSAIRRSNGGVGEDNACKDEGCSDKTKNRVPAKKQHHWYPGIQEDYYGPRSHRPRHH